MAAPAQLPPSLIEAAPARNEDEWELSFDVVVVGFGAAGSAAAIEARRAGARVLVIDRFRGGGATARSGGVFYAGGGSLQQQAAGYEDSPIHVTGNARMDLLRQELRPFFDADVDRLRERFGPFILINTNFSRLNHYFPGQSRQRRALESGPPVDPVLMARLGIPDRQCVRGDRIFK